MREGFIRRVEDGDEGDPTRPFVERYAWCRLCCYPRWCGCADVAGSKIRVVCVMHRIFSSSLRESSRSRICESVIVRAKLAETPRTIEYNSAAGGITRYEVGWGSRGRGEGRLKDISNRHAKGIGSRHKHTVHTNPLRQTIILWITAVLLLLLRVVAVVLQLYPHRGC